MRMTRKEFLECYEKVYVCGERDKCKALEFLDFLGKGNVLNITPNELKQKLSIIFISVSRKEKK